MSEEKRVSQTGIIPPEMRGQIRGNLPPRVARLGGNVTNAQYAKENNCTKRQASKKRRGY